MRVRDSGDVVLVVIFGGHFLLGRAFPFTFYVILDIFIFYLSFCFYKKGFQEVLDEKGLLVGVACHFTPVLVQILLRCQVDARNVSVEQKHEPHKDESWGTQQNQNYCQGENPPFLCHHRNAHNSRHYDRNQQAQ